MSKNNFLITALLFCLILISGCASKKKTVQPKPKAPAEVKTEIPEVESPINEIENIEEVRNPSKIAPYVMREFRAAWIATVANINWPSKSGLSTKQQQEEAIKLLDFLKDHNYNAVIFQARPQADALYKSDLEPWSFFLSGTVGKAPEPYYDPLEFWIKEAHERGLELHVWLNPYRAHHTTGGKISEKSLVKKHPEFAVELKNGMWWMDPSKQTTQDHSSAVVMDIVKRYDIDGIHFDDYFYPYASYNKGQDFPDAASYQAYLKAGGKLSKPDWRREEVNVFVERIYKEIKAEKPEVKFGISPFGIWRPGFPKSIAGMDQYNELYADAKLWLNKGWIDYFTPQLYWKINQTKQSFPVLLGWWDEENTQKRHLWPGINIDFGGDEENVDETINQIMLTRGMLTDSKGTVHWSIGPLLKYPNLSKNILEGPYKNEALVPASEWLDQTIPATPKVKTDLSEDRLEIQWEHENLNNISNWVVYYRSNATWNYKIISRTENSYSLSNFLDKKEQKSPIVSIGVTAISKTGIESDFEEILIRKTALKPEF
ncbi:glycoside hydrolase family 10 protein [Gillisia marina]|uniref:glycoside hydrolase family 10 protein n=1 Tax=Gillisia marina TaxID=1167637 RepID=UPI00029B0AA7|nr:family 10 glycosylhydrolase [Gillisia marina]